MRVDKSVDSDSMTSLPPAMDVVMDRSSRKLEAPLTAHPPQGQGVVL
jgi:hypothetical protein